jgi:hypothetical protein
VDAKAGPQARLFNSAVQLMSHFLRDFEKGDEPDRRRQIGGDQVVESDASLADVIEVLTRHDYCFVGSPGNLTGAIDRSDIQKPVARMWLFRALSSPESPLLSCMRKSPPVIYGRTNAGNHF